ncbi:MAG: biopolymer transporter ExbD [Spirochaetota bacterium]|nr:biopolymer transporter ExbD [Spirochaetota bacterium]
MFSKYKKKHTISADISMTPMIDIIFQLLTFFMITSTFIQTSSLNIDLPEAKTSDSIQDQQNTITLYKNNSITWNEQEISITDLPQKLLELSQQNPDATLVIQGDEGISYGNLIEIMDQARGAGLNKLSLATILKK